MASSGTLLASLPPTELCVSQDPAAVPAHPRLGGHCWDTPGLLLLPQGLGGAGGVKEEPLIWGLPTLAGLRADLRSGLGSILHWSCHPSGTGTVVVGSPNQGCVWLKSSSELALAWPFIMLPLLYSLTTSCWSLRYGREGREYRPGGMRAAFWT